MACLAGREVVVVVVVGVVERRKGEGWEEGGGENKEGVDGRVGRRTKPWRDWERKDKAVSRRYIGLEDMVFFSRLCVVGVFVFGAQKVRLPRIKSYRKKMNQAKGCFPVGVAVLISEK